MAAWHQGVAAVTGSGHWMYSEYRMLTTHGHGDERRDLNLYKNGRLHLDFFRSLERLPQCPSLSTVMSSLYIPSGFYLERSVFLKELQRCDKVSLRRYMAIYCLVRFGGQHSQGGDIRYRYIPLAPSFCVDTGLSAKNSEDCLQRIKPGSSPAGILRPHCLVVTWLRQRAVDEMAEGSSPESLCRGTGFLAND